MSTKPLHNLPIMPTKLFTSFHDVHKMGHINFQSICIKLSKETQSAETHSSTAPNKSTHFPPSLLPPPPLSLF